MDTRPGNLDTWPAHAQGPAPPATGAETSQRNAEFLPKSNYKPKFLGQLESFLKKELRALGCTDNKPSEKRLQVCCAVLKNIKHFQKNISKVGSYFKF
jgi:hypothetical protein